MDIIDSDQRTDHSDYYYNEIQHYERLADSYHQTDIKSIIAINLTTEHIH